MAISLTHVTFECAHAANLAAFWGRMVEREVAFGADGSMAAIGRFRDVPELRFLGQAANRKSSGRLRLEFATDDWLAEMDRMVWHGARLLGEVHDGGIARATLLDPEGNIFCLNELRG
ncbi:MAG: VOC family protein [Mycobacteriaceae bacterium]|nr:VOC family protein [Mycobacteriaceae bacterium]